MARQIDERVVEMRFDNKQFESATKTTMNTLSQLKKSLDFSKSGQSLYQLDKSVKAFSFEGMASGIDALEKRFSTMGIIGMRVIENLTDSVMNFVNKGLRYMEDAIVSGGIRRAMNLEKAHFQLQNIIGDETRVQEVMDSANRSVDGTAYSFDVAAKAASQFYASGVTDIDNMDQALRGLAGTTATFSADYDQMAMIWTQVAGQGRLMGDQLLQLSTRGANAAVEIMKFMNGINDGSIQASDNVTAAVKAISTATDITEADVHEFVSDSEISFDIFAEAMNHAFGDSAQKANETFDGALANIKSAFARIGAGFISPLIAQNNEVVELFNTIREKVNDVKKVLVFDEELGNVTAISKRFTDSVLNMAKSLSTFIKNADISTPLEIFTDGISILVNLFKSLLTVVSPIYQALKDTFQIPLKAVKDFTGGLVNMTKNLSLTGTASKNLYDTVKGVSDIFKLLLGVLSKLIGPTLSFTNAFGEGLLGVTGSIGRSLSAFAEWIQTAPIVKEVSDKISSGFNTIATIAGTVKEKVTGIIESFKNLTIVQSAISGVYLVFDAFKSLLNEIANLFDRIAAKIGPKIINVFTSIGKAASSFGKTLGDSIRKNGYDGFNDLLNSGVLVALGAAFTKLILNFGNFTKSATTMFSGVKGIFSNLNGIFKTADSALKMLKDTLEAYQNEINSKILLNIAIAVGILSASLIALALVDPDKLTAGIGSITFLFAELIGSFAIFQKILKPSIKNLTSAGAGMIAISAAILILSAALAKIATIDPDRIIKSLGAITILIGDMSLAAVTISKFGGKIKTGAIGMIGFATAIYILTSAVKKLGSLDVPTLQKGIIAVGSLMAELAAFMIAAQFGKIKPSQAVGIIGISAALIILAEAVKRFGELDVETLYTGILAMGAILGELAIFNIASGQSKHVITSAASLVIMAKAMDMMVSPLTAFGKFSVAEIGKSLFTMAGALAAITLAVKLMPATTPVIAAGVAIFAAAIGMLVESLQSMGAMSWEQIGKSLITLAAALTILATAMAAMNGTLAGSAAMLIMAASLKVFVPVLKALGSMSWQAIVTGLIALAGAFAVVGVAGVALGPLVPTLLGLSAAIALLGVSVLAIGTGLVAFATGLTMLSVAAKAGADALVEISRIWLTGVLQTIIDSAELIGAAVKTVILVLCDVIKECVPEIVDTILVVIMEVLDSLLKYVPTIVVGLMDFVIGIIDALALELPKLTESIVNVVVEFFAGIGKAIKGVDVSVLQDGLVGVGVITAIVAGMSLLSGMVPAAMVGILAFGALVAELALVLAAVGALNKIPGLNWLIGQGGELLQGVGTAIGKFVGGIIGGGMAGIAAQLPSVGSDLSTFMENVQGFISGAASMDQAALGGIGSLVKAIVLLTGADIINGLTSWLTGGSSLQRFGEELEAFAPSFVSFSNQIAGVNSEAVSASANAALVLAQMADTLPNTGGLSAKIFGDNTLSAFGEELEKFAPYLSSYANAISGVNPEAVQASAQAALILAEMASTLPNTGGLSAKIFGDNTLSAFGEELEKFGPPLGAYCEYVRGVNPEAVQASAQAAQIMADMANTLPNSGGLAAKIFGDNTLSAFGEELKAFGPSIKAYADSVSGLKPDVVTASANAAMALSQLAANLPNSGGLVSWFTGDNTLDDFGKQLEKLGIGLAAYYEKISTISVGTFDGCTTALKNLVSAVSSAQGISADAVTGIVDGLNKSAMTGISQFTSAFQNAGGQVTSAISSFVNSAVNALSLNTTRYTTEGVKAVTAYLTAVRNQFQNATSTGQQLATKILSVLQQKVSEFRTKGVASATSYNSGITSKKTDAENAGKSLANSASGALTNVATLFKTAGENCGKSFCSGVRSYEEEAKRAGAAIGRAAYNAAKAEMKINSPSKKMIELGRYTGEGFAVGIDNSTDRVTRSAKEMAEGSFMAMSNAISNISSLVESNMDFDPTITPNVNLDNIVAGSEEISKMFNNAIKNTAMTVEGLNFQMSKTRNGSGAIASEPTADDVGVSRSGDVNFYQYNTSPKALSRIDIYRQTQNQLTQFEQVVGSKK